MSNQRSPLFDMAMLVGLVSVGLFLLITIIEAWGR
jgi:hypothetical protein